MPRQRLVLVALVIVAVLGLASVVGEPPPRSAEETTPGPATPLVAPGRVVAADVDVRAERRRVVRARAGDVVALRLSAPDGRVAVPELGVEESTIAGVPTVVRFSVLAAGRFAVRIGDPPRRSVATVVVVPRRDAPRPRTPRPTTPGDQAITAAAPTAAG